MLDVRAKVHIAVLRPFTVDLLQETQAFHVDVIPPRAVDPLAPQVTRWGE
ncbi:MAG: hypothetical protein OXN89_01005 [Bryobacterales bacterium]|nr:hypothetical protein [Bryobacterales bacterium]